MILLILKLLACAMVGIVYQLIKKHNSMFTKSQLSNVIYPGFWGFVKLDYRSIMGSIGAVLLLMLIFGDGLNPDNWGLKGDVEILFHWLTVSKRVLFEAFLSLMFATTGYAGQDLALRLLSKTNDKINAAIDYKTTLIDKVNNTTDKPTPI